ncbi:MoaD/ThiS family protein [Chloroflexota bacterium]
MSKVQLNIPPWVGIILDENTSTWFNLEKEIGEETTIDSLLTDLAFSYPDFRKTVFNPDVGKVSDQVNIVLNDNLLHSTDLTDTKLNDGDSITILPAYAGG